MWQTDVWLQNQENSGYNNEGAGYNEGYNESYYPSASSTAQITTNRENANGMAPVGWGYVEEPVDRKGWGMAPATPLPTVSPCYDSIEESVSELKKKLEKAKAENAELQKQIIQYEVEMLSDQVGGDVFIDQDQVPEIVAELGRQNVQLKEKYETSQKEKERLKKEVEQLREQVEQQARALVNADAAPSNVSEEQNLIQIDNLQRYIRSKAQEVVEGKTEWSRQIAELRLDFSDAEQKVARMKREKEDIVRRTEIELSILRNKLGIENENEHDENGTYHSNIMDGVIVIDPEEHARLREKWELAEDRVTELETYIRTNPTAAPKEVKDSLINTSYQLKSTRTAIGELQVIHERTIDFWQRSCHRLIAAIRKHLDGTTVPPRLIESSRDASFGDQYDVLKLNTASIIPNAIPLTDVLHSVICDLEQYLEIGNRTITKNEAGQIIKGIGHNFLGNRSNTSQIIARRYSLIQGNLDRLKSNRKDIANCVMKVEKGLRDVQKDLKTGSTGSNNKKINQQLVRHSETLGKLLMTFVELPTLLKRMFDLSKESLGQDEINTLLRDVQVIQDDAQCIKNKYDFFHTLQQERFIPMHDRYHLLQYSQARSRCWNNEVTIRRVRSDPDLTTIVPVDVEGEERNNEKEILTSDNMNQIRLKIRHTMQQRDAEEQLVQIALSAHRLEEQVQKQQKRLDQVEENLVDLHVVKISNRQPSKSTNRTQKEEKQKEKK